MSNRNESLVSNYLFRFVTRHIHISINSEYTASTGQGKEFTDWSFLIMRCDTTNSMLVKFFSIPKTRVNQVM